MANFPGFSRLIHGLHFNNLRGDIFGGITAAVVALPLALAFGVSSGIGAINGLYGAIATGFLAALFGGTPSQITGPTGPMTVVVTSVFLQISAAHPDDPAKAFAITLTVILLGGLFQILLGILRLGQYITLISYTVISGFMSGIGVIIILIELGPLAGYRSGANVVASLKELPIVLENLNGGALGLSLITLAIVFGMPKRWNKILPAPLVALVVGTLLSVILPIDIPLIGEIPTGLPSLHWPVFSTGELGTMVRYGLMLAVLGAIDSLLTSLVADNITQTQHDSDRELIGQGIGNMVAGLLGGLPGAGATMRTVVNVKAGGRTPIAGMIHALMLLVMVLGAGPLTEAIPQAVLAGILVKVGIDIIDWSFIKRAHRISLRATGLMYCVLLLTVFVDLITAVAVGVFIANMLTVKSLTEVQIEGISTISDGSSSVLTTDEQALFQQAGGKILLFHLSGPMSFGAAKSMSQRLAVVNPYQVLILDLLEVPRMGVTASLAIENMVKEARENRRDVFIVGAKGKVKERLKRLEVLDRVPPQNLVLTRLEALQQAIHLVEMKDYIPAVKP